MQSSRGLSHDALYGDLSSTRKSVLHLPAYIPRVITGTGAHMSYKRIKSAQGIWENRRHHQRVTLKRITSESSSFFNAKLFLMTYNRIASKVLAGSVRPATNKKPQKAKRVPVLINRNRHLTVREVEKDLGTHQFLVKSFCLIQVRQPPWSPDLAPCDF